MIYYFLIMRVRVNISSLAALNLIGPRAMDVLSELSYVSMTPEHFPSLFCKVSRGRRLSPSFTASRLYLPSFACHRK